MVVLALILLGLTLGSFVNAVVWRLHEQQRSAVSGQRSAKRGQSKKLSANSYPLTASDLSILKGRSMCPNCHHTLAVRDLVPVLSWLSLGGKCRYCHKPISWQYPLVELSMVVLFVGTYLWWPYNLSGFQIANLVFWLAIIVILMVLTIFDIRWMILPNKIIYPLLGVSVAWILVRIVATNNIGLIGDATASIGLIGGLFYVLFTASSGRWIGGGDVKLGFIIGALLGDPGKALLTIFIASLIGTVVALPLLGTKRLKRTTRIPFGPSLMLATLIAQLFGTAIIAWYSHLVVFT